MLGVMGATHEEILGLEFHIKNRSYQCIAQRKYISGELYGVPVVIVLSRWGKVAAASTATTLIQKFNINSLVMTGLAGALAENLNIGDIVVASNLYQHDLDPRPLFKRFEIPYLNKVSIHTDEYLSKVALKASQKFLQRNLFTNSIYFGPIVSGDQFIDQAEHRKRLQNICNDALALEMEGAAVAQVCYENNLPFTVIRTISDAANKSSAFNFSDFLKNKAPIYTLGIMKEFIEILETEKK